MTPASVAPPTTTAALPAPTPTPRPVASPRMAALPPKPVASVAPPAATPLPASPTPPPTTQPAAGMLQVAVRPWAEVFLDGKPLGTTPLDRLALPSGDHVVRVRHPAFEPLERHVSVKPGETTKLIVDLPAEGVAKKP